jgi:hypothetical protein
MISFNYGILLIFAVIAYMMIMDPNINEYITLIFKILKVNTKRMLWMIRFHPKNPITNLMMRWKYDKIARDLQKEFSERG